MSKLRNRFPWFFKLPAWGQIGVAFCLWPLIILILIVILTPSRNTRNWAATGWIILCVVGVSAGASSPSLSTGVANSIRSSSANSSQSGGGGQLQAKNDQLQTELKEAELRTQDAQKLQQELEKKIAASQKINEQMDEEQEVGIATDFNLAKSANQSIAVLGSTTQNQKMFQVLEIVDGDTIKVTELGTLRLIGMDTPETKDPRKIVQCFGQQASDRAKELLQNQQVYLEFDPANRLDKYGRTLAYVYRQDNYFFNREMVRDGFAHSYTKYPHPKLDEFNQAQQEARDDKRGFWSDRTCQGNTEQVANPVANSSSSTSSKPIMPAPRPISGAPTASSASSKSSSDNRAGCDAAYPTICLPSSPDLDCGEIPHRRFPVLPPDPHRLDGKDNDGIGCES